jgi:type IV pilus assembly protein PilW
VPVRITANATAGMPDTVRVLASGKPEFALPLRIVTPGYKKNDTIVPVASVLGVQWNDSAKSIVGDLMVLAVNSTTPCGVFQVTDSPGVTTDIKRGDDAAWNAPATPAESYGSGSFAINLGSQPIDVTYSIADGSLRATTLRINGTTYEPTYDSSVELFPNIVNLQAYYGKDTANKGVVDKWDRVTPTTNAEWLQVIAVRVAIVARSAQFEKEEVTHDNLLWDVGSSIAMTGSEDCNGGKSKCLRLKIDHLEDYKRYRYRVFDTVIPLRNMLWNS